MTTPFPLVFDDGRVATGVRVERPGDLPDAVAQLGLSSPRPVLVVVGGAGGLDPADEQRLEQLFASGVIPVVEDAGAVAVDGGTRSGIMCLHGQARARLAATYPLVGVAAAGTVVLPGYGSRSAHTEMLDQHHTHFVMVPGDDWGSEAPWIASTATTVAAGTPSITVVVNGGEIVYSDVERSLDAGRPVLTVDGTGRTADQLAAAVRGERADQRAHRLAGSGRISVGRVGDAEGVARAISAALSVASASGR